MIEFLNHFHFLRPEVLFALLALPFLILLFRKKATYRDDWSRYIAPELLSHLRPSASERRTQSFTLALACTFCLAIIAMAGPAWEKKAVPVFEKSDDLVVILDLSISMLAKDISPNRLTRAKQKLQDLLTQRKEGNTALIVFSGDAHVVTPLSDDTKTIIANLPALTPFNMPLIGSRPDLAIQEAIKLLNQASSTQGRIVLITDGVTEKQIDQIIEMKALPELSVLAIGTENGAPIDLGERGYLKQNGEVVIPKTDFRTLADLATQAGGTIAKLTLDDRDLKLLRTSDASPQQSEEDSQNMDARFDNWEDAGYWLILAILPLVLFAHRQGAFLLVLVFVLPISETQANDWNWKDLWQTRDQQAQTLMEQQKYQEAAALFESPSHQLYAEARANALSDDQNTAAFNADDHYNHGTGLAKQGQLAEALESLNRALELDPNHDDALFNKQVVEDMLAQQEQQSQDSSQDQESQDSQSDSQQSQDQQSQDQQSENDSENNQPSENQSGEQNQQDSQNSSDSKSQQQSPTQSQAEQNAQPNNDKQEQNDGNSQENQQNDQIESAVDAPQNQEDTSQAGKPSNEFAAREDLSDEEKQSFEQWMRRVPDDPGGLLRRKFEHQSRQRNRLEREEGDPLW